MRTIILTLAIVSTSLIVFSQKWELNSDKDGIKVYLKKEIGKATKSYKVVSTVNADLKTVVSIFGNFKMYPKWFSEMKNFTLLINTSKKAVYYTVFDMPIPFTNRDLVVNIDISHPTKDKYVYKSTIPKKTYFSETLKYVRIKTFQETATLKAISKNKVLITFIGNGDLGGNVPTWLQNMFIDRGSVSMIRTIKRKIK